MQIILWLVLNLGGSVPFSNGATQATQATQRGPAFGSGVG